jgi:hypothetical protein
MLQNIMTQEINSAIATAFNERLESERDIALERDQYQRVAGSVKRNGFKPFTIAGLFGRILPCGGRWRAAALLCCRLQRP